jgi:hypothetical protein
MFGLKFGMQGLTFNHQNSQTNNNFKRFFKAIFFREK